jgi:hypothetical protein
MGLGEKRNAYKIMVGKPEGKTPLRRPRSRWEDNIKINFKEGWEVVESVHLAQDMDQWRYLATTQSPPYSLCPYIIQVSKEQVMSMYSTK